MKNGTKTFLGMNAAGAVALVVFIVIALIVFSFVPPPSHAPTVTLTQPVVLGSYTGSLPCADCAGIQETLTLTQKDASSAEGTYIRTDTYMDKGTFTTQGTWTTIKGDATDENAVVYELDPDGGSPTYYLKVDADSIRQLSPDLKEIDSPFDQTLSTNKDADAWIATPVDSLTKALKGQANFQQNAADFSTAVDLTGDGVPEGLFITWKGATGTSATIFTQSGNGPVALKMKGQDGTVSVVALTDARGATAGAFYTLLPEAHAFYTYMESNTSSDASNPQIACDPNSFGVYAWSDQTHEFEWSQILTDKYKPMVCR